MLMLLATWLTLICCCCCHYAMLFIEGQWHLLYYSVAASVTVAASDYADVADIWFLNIMMIMAATLDFS